MLQTQVAFLSKKILAGITCLTIFATLTACNSTTSTESDSQSQIVESEVIQPQTKSGQKSNQELAWQEAGALPLPLESHQMVVLGEFVYVLGGWNDDQGPYADVFFAPFNTDKILDNWQPTRAKMPLRLQHHAAITHNNSIYVLGGDNGFGENFTVADRILRATPNEQGDITKWENAGQLPKPMTIHSVSKVGDRLYVFGGSSTFSPKTQVIDKVHTATISPTGEISSFQDLKPMPAPMGWQTTTVVDNHIYAVSGKTQFKPSQLSETIGRAEILETGFLTEFESVGTTAPRERHTTVKVGDNLVVIAGGGDKEVLSEVEAIALDADGNLKTKQKLPPLPEPRYAHAAFAHNGYIYVSGGFTRYGSNETSTKIFRLPVGSLIED